MAALVGALRVTLGANTAQYEAGMRRAQAATRHAGLGIRRELQQAQRSTTMAFRAMAGVAATFGLGAGVRSMMNFIDAAKQLEAQLRLATRESGNFAQAQADVRRIAQETRTGLSETASLYAVFQRNARELGISQEQAARATRTVSQAFQISGASAAEAAGGLRQFLQGVQSGTLRGEELNSVLENAPRLARLLADSLGVTTGQLRAMGAEGQLTADKLIRALTERQFTEQIDAEFRELPVTFEQAMTAVHNAAIVAFGAFDRGGQFSNALIDFMGVGRMSFEEIEGYAFQTGQEIRAIMSGLANVFEPMGIGASNVFEFIRNEAVGLRSAIDDILSGLDSAAEGLRTAVIRVGAATGVSPATLDQALPSATPVAPRFRQGSNSGGILGAFEQARQTVVRGMAARGGGSGRPAPPRRLSGGGGGGRRLGGGGGGRRRAGGGGGGGGGRRAAPAQLVDIPFELPWLQDGGTSAGELFDQQMRPLLGTAEEVAERLAQAHAESTALVSQLLQPLPSIADQVLSEDDQQRLEQFAQGFTRDLADGLTAAIMHGENLGDVLISTIQRAAAELISSSLVQLLSGGTFGGKGGVGGVLSFVTSALGSTFGGKRAAGGPVLPGRHYVVGEKGPELLTMGRQHGFITPNGAGPSRVQVVPSPYFDLVVDGRVVRTGAPMVAAGMSSARTGAQADLHRRAARTIP